MSEAMKRFQKTKLIFALIFVSWLSCFVPSAGAFQFNVDPPKVSLSIKPGEKKSGYIHITNTSKKDIIHIKAYSLDVIYLPDGSNDFVPVGSTPWSLKDWLKINPNEFDILPNQEQTVRFQVKLPPEVKGGFYGVIFFEMNSPQQLKKEQTTITIGVRIGTIVLVEAAGTAEYAAKINALEIVKKDNGYQIGCTIQNSGNILIRPFGKAQILNAANKVAVEVSLNPNKEGIFPQTSRKLTVDYKEPLGQGQYLVRLLLDYGGETLLGAQASFNANSGE
jgi:hypothetical protein